MWTQVPSASQAQAHLGSGTWQSVKQLLHDDDWMQGVRLVTSTPVLWHDGMALISTKPVSGTCLVILPA